MLSFFAGFIIGGALVILVPMLVAELLQRFFATDWEAEPEATELAIASSTRDTSRVGRTNTWSEEEST